LPYIDLDQRENAELGRSMSGQIEPHRGQPRAEEAGAEPARSGRTRGGREQRRPGLDRRQELKLELDVELKTDEN
jgi:hypothetical protein